MNITAAMVKELRERTGSGMMECKKALVETSGDVDAAIENMRKTGLAKADKKSGRIAAEGCIAVKISADEKIAAIVEVNCETDFVSKGENFEGFASQVVEQGLKDGVNTLEKLLEQPLNGDGSIEETRRSLVAKLGENINVRRFEQLTCEQGIVAAYLHGNGIGVLVQLTSDDAVLGKDIAMHIAASKPVCVEEKDVSQEAIAKEKEIFTAQAADSGKSPEIIEKMIAGRIRKYIGEITLTGQPFIKNPDIKVGQLLKEKSNSVTGFCRFEVGEGIEKKEENFLEEVMAQVKGGE
ncbi:MAG: translation elongation factor Ts [Methylococcales bacterium]